MCPYPQLSSSRINVNSFYTWVLTPIISTVIYALLSLVLVLSSLSPHFMNTLSLTEFAPPFLCPFLSRWLSWAPRSMPGSSRCTLTAAHCSPSPDAHIPWRFSTRQNRSGTTWRRPSALWSRSTCVRWMKGTLCSFSLDKRYIFLMQDYEL